MQAHLTGLLALALLLLAWLGVQRAWGRAFPEACDDPDPLAGRIGCSGAACPKQREGACPHAEEKR